jgi:hypothetical protein
MATLVFFSLPFYFLYFLALSCSTGMARESTTLQVVLFYQTATLNQLASPLKVLPSVIWHLLITFLYALSFYFGQQGIGLVDAHYH